MFFHPFRQRRTGCQAVGCFRSYVNFVIPCNDAKLSVNLCVTEEIWIAKG